MRNQTSQDVKTHTPPPPPISDRLSDAHDPDLSMDLFKDWREVGQDPKNGKLKRNIFGFLKANLR